MILKSATLAVLWLAAICLYGQSQFSVIPPVPLAATITGIKITSSSFDPQTKIVKLTFINDAAADITAYHYCIHVESSVSGLSQECALIDPLGSVLDEKGQIQEHGSAAHRGGPEYNVVHPGEERTIQRTIDYNHNINGSVSVDFVAWSDSTFEGSPEQMKQLTMDRSVAMQERQFVSATIKDVLAHGNEDTLIPMVLVALRTEVERFTPVQKRSDATAHNVLDNEINRLQVYLDRTASYHFSQREALAKIAARSDWQAKEVLRHSSLRKVGDQ